MSFGFSVGDILVIAQLVERTRRRFKGAPAEYNALADETRTLQIVVNDLKIQVEDDELADSIKDDLRNAMTNCETVLLDLNTVIDAHTELDSATIVPRRGPQRIWKRLRWDPKEASQLRSRLSSSIQLLVAVRQSLDSTLQREIAQDLARLTINHDKERVQRVADWLAPGTYSAHQHDYFTKVQAGTGQWVFTDPIYCRWLNDAGPSTLLLPGIPGAGKTFIASIIINSLQARVSQHDNSGLVFFYNSFRRTATQSCHHIVSSMVRQLYLQKPTKNNAVDSVYEEQHKHMAPAAPSLEEMCAIFEKLLSGFSLVTFVMDALDECKGPEGSDERPWKYILSFIFGLQEKLKSQVAIKVLATSRPDPEINGVFPKDGRLTIHARNDDLGKFCDSLIPKIRCIAQKTDLHPKIKDAICDSAGGMFLLAKLHCDTLATKTKPRDVLQALKAFAQGGDALDRAYMDTLQRIQSQPEEHSTLARKVLVCVAFSVRPLTLDEIRHALAVDEETKELDPEYDLDDPDDVISSCAGLVTIDSETQIVRLVHYTTQSFLESLGSRLMPYPHDFLASCCLNYLFLDAFADCHFDGKSTIDQKDAFPFAAYSAQYWIWHVSSGSDNVSLRQRAFSFLDNTGRVTATLRLSHLHSANVHGLCALHLLAFIGSNDWITDYISRGPQTHQNERVNGVCLECRESAAEFRRRLGDDKTSWVTLLTSWRGSSQRTPLWYAIDQRHVSTANLLIDLNNGILNDLDDHGLPPLSFALQSRLEAVPLRILAEPEAISWYQHRGSVYETYLHYAALCGDEAVVDRLLELISALDSSEARNIAISYTTAQNKWGGTALSHAARLGCLGIVKKLLAYSGGRELNVADKEGCTPLHAAASVGSLEVVQYLMGQRGIQADVCDRYGRSALHWAADAGAVPVIEYLLSAGLPANSKSHNGRNALLHALYSHRPESALYLASRDDVDLHCTDKYGMNALMIAAWHRYADGVVRFASEVPDINLTDDEGDTALHHLCKVPGLRWEIDIGNKFQPCLQALISNGADWNIKNQKGETPYAILCRQSQNLTSWWDRPALEEWQVVKSIWDSYLPDTMAN
ncbi:hypothetical protein AYO21_06246 [Fonsecaea monophora]|uniref:Uncharacterized protein n=1 Tax=Fonsecaea monophora TaxID=254056 RepID=A0A177F844_9EURO|nr:hypothetical protein AYO21_06246 [Fonsecaea monophora]OAG39602.1 hypothetical protein AYO21_06246 [Fonsecaea monophora]